MPVASAFAPGPHRQPPSPLRYQGNSRDGCSGLKITPNFSFASQDGLQPRKAGVAPLVAKKRSVGGTALGGKRSILNGEMKMTPHCLRQGLLTTIACSQSSVMLGLAAYMPSAQFRVQQCSHDLKLFGFFNVSYRSCTLGPRFFQGAHALQ
jgi:hypothetical protein